MSPFARLFLSDEGAEPRQLVTGARHDEALSACISLFEKHPMPMWVQDAAQGRIMAVNDAAIKLYGIEREQFLDLHYTDLLAESLHDMPRHASATPLHDEVVNHRLPGEPKAWIKLSVSPWPLSGVGALLVMATDVTQQHREADLLQHTLIELRRVQDIEHRERAAADQARQAMAALSQRLIGVQERERRAIARELHDEIGQSLSVIRVQFAKLRRRVEGSELLTLIDAASTMAEQTLGRVRNLSLMLHPPQLETLGLAAALRWHVQQVAQLHGLDVRFDAKPIERPVDPDVAIALYRIVQESLSNVVKHAQAFQACVMLHADEQAVEVSITDNGIGFDPPSLQQRWQDFPSLGLIGMQERARQLGGELLVTSRPGEGTHVRARLPWKVPK